MSTAMLTCRTTLLSVVLHSLTTVVQVIE